MRERGIDSEAISYEGTDLEKKLTNMDPVRRQRDEYITVCLKDVSSSLSAKTIVFTITHKHTLRLEMVFKEI